MAEPLANLPFEYRLGKRYLYGEAGAQPLFTNNETNAPRVWGWGAESRSPYVKDAFHRHIINGEQCVNPEQTGTKACLHLPIGRAAGGSIVIRLRLTDRETKRRPPMWIRSRARRAECDEFTRASIPRWRPKMSAACSGRRSPACCGEADLIYDVNVWLDGDNPNGRRRIAPPDQDFRWRQSQHDARHVDADKWEYRVCGVGPRFHWCRSRSSIRNRQRAALAAAVRAVQHPNGRYRHTSGSSDLNPGSCVGRWRI